MQAFFNSVKQFLGRLTTGQQAALALVVVGSAALLAGIAHWSSQPDYALLFGNLGATDANSVVEALREEGTAYELREQGSAVYVPRAAVHELRLRFASEGLVSDGQVGYELFDQGTLGMTDFMQKLNLKRALEGELAHTVSSIGQVEMARVHLVLPERNPFREAQTQPSASVVLKLSGGALSAAQIQGITALVAGAVERLAPAEVTVLDTQGNMLSDPEAGDAELRLTSTQLDMQRSVEEHLAESGQSMLDQVLGPGNALVRVSATLDFDRTVSEREAIDPESATVISEERMEEGGEGTNANSTVRNYDLSRTRERSEKSVGDVSYLTVSVIMNYDRQPGAQGNGEDSEPVYAPRSEVELTEIESLVKNAVGFKPERGDRFTIQQTRFDTSVDDQVVTAMQERRQEERFQMYLRYGLIALALLLAVWLVRSTTRRLLHGGEDAPIWLKQSSPSKLGDAVASSADGEQRLAAAKGEEEEEEVVLVDDIYTSKLSPEARARLKAKHLMFEEIQEQALQQPEETVELIRSWLAADATP